MGLLGALSKIGMAVAAPFTGGASLTPMLVGAALGAGKHFLADKPAENRKRKAAAEVMRYSPWTGMQAPEVKESSLFDSLASGASIGGTLGAAGAAAGAEGAIKGAGTALGAGGTPALGVAEGFKQGTAGLGAGLGAGLPGAALPSAAGIAAPELGASLAAATPAANAGLGLGANVPSFVPKLGVGGEAVSALAKGPGRYQPQGPDQSNDSGVKYKRKPMMASAWNQMGPGRGPAY